jgi:hypothetical protein
MEIRITGQLYLVSIHCGNGRKSSQPRLTFAVAAKSGSLVSQCIGGQILDRREA